MIKVIILLVVTYIFNLIDYVQTIYAIHFFGLSAELNPIVRVLFECGYADEVKIFAPLILLTALGFIVWADRRNIWVVYCAVIPYSLLILHNFAIILKMDMFL